MSYSVFRRGGEGGGKARHLRQPPRSRYCENIMRFFWLLAATAVIALPAHADAGRDALSAVAKCADIAAATERLDCYDKAAAMAKTAMSAAPAPVQQATAETKREEEGGGILQWFGLESKRPITKAEDFGKPPAPVMDGPREVTEISAGVLELAKNAYGRSLFVLDNGQVWKQVDGDTMDVAEPRSGETLKITIGKALFGSYSLTIEGRTGIVKVRRVK